MVQRIALANERGFALVDDDDFPLVSKYRWRIVKTPTTGLFYAKAWIEPRPRPRSQWMHILIMGRPGIDHRNGDGLDNRRENLRFATQSQNMAARRPVGASGYKGVYYDRRRNRWYAYIGTSKNRRHLGTYRNPEDAARAYDAAALEAWGEYARLNFP